MPSMLANSFTFLHILILLRTSFVSATEQAMASSVVRRCAPYGWVKVRERFRLNVVSVGVPEFFD